MNDIVIAHGGVDVALTDHYRATVERAALAGARHLSAGVLDAVEATIVVMEQDPAFNAGIGGVLNRDGTVELDALIIDGSTGRAGAVAAIQGVANAISVARRVAETTPYVLLVGDGAGLFAREQGFPATDCVTAEQFEAWRQMRERGSLAEIGLNPFTGQPEPPSPSDTVGCVVQAAGRMAAGVSTGGVFFKAPGRVGDSAIVGAGAYACEFGAVAATGVGEAFHELLLCRCVSEQLERGVHPQEAVEEAIRHLWRRRQGIGGIIAVDRNGRTGMAYNGKSLAAAVVIDGQLAPSEPQHVDT